MLASTISTTEDYYDANTESDLFLRVRREKNRTITDTVHLFAFFMFLALWIGIAIHALTVGVPSPEIMKNINIGRNLDLINKSLYEGRNVCFGFIWLAIWILALYFIMIRLFTKFMVYTTLVLMLGVNIILISLLVILLVNSPSEAASLFILIMVAVFTFYITLLYILKKEGTEELCKIIKDSCSAMICFPSSLVVVIFKITLCLLVVSFTAIVVFYLAMIVNSESRKCYTDSNDGRTHYCHSNDNVPIYAFILMGIHICISVWVICFIWTFARMVLHGIFASWYRTSDKSTISYMTTPRQLAITLRYHVGTIAFGSTIFTIIQTTRAIFHSARTQVKEIQRRPILLFCLCIAFTHASANALIACIIHGNGFYQSSKHAIKCIMQKPMTFVASRSITHWMLAFGVILIPAFTLCTVFSYFRSQSYQYEPTVPEISMVAIGIFSFLTTFILLDIFNAAIEAVLYCSIEEWNLHKAMVEDNDSYNEELRRIVNV